MTADETSQPPAPEPIPVLSELWDAFLAWVATQPGVTDAEDVGEDLLAGGPAGSYFGGFALGGVPVSVTMSYTE